MDYSRLFYSLSTFYLAFGSQMKYPIIINDANENEIKWNKKIKS